MIVNYKFLDTLKEIILFVSVTVANDMHRKLDTSVRNMTGTVTANWSKGMLCQELKQASKICNQYSLYACEHFISKLLYV